VTCSSIDNYQSFGGGKLLHDVGIHVLNYISQCLKDGNGPLILLFRDNRLIETCINEEQGSRLWHQQLGLTQKNLSLLEFTVQIQWQDNASSTLREHLMVQTVWQPAVDVLSFISFLLTNLPIIYNTPPISNKHVCEVMAEERSCFSSRLLVILWSIWLPQAQKYL
jgi:hypothetical protein